MYPPTARLSALGALAVACPVLTATLAARVLTGLTVEIWTVDHLVGLIVMAVGVLVGFWLSAWLSISALCVAGAAFGARLRRAEQLLTAHGPTALRKLVATAIGVGLTAAAPALADDGLPAPDPVLAELAWTVPEQAAHTVPENPVSAHPSESPAPTMHGAPDDAVRRETAGEVAVDQGATVLKEVADAQTVIVVQPGDSLWRIAAAHLAPGASVEQISAEWPRWYALNKDVIGANPDHIRPGQELVSPTAPTQSGHQ